MKKLLSVFFITAITCGTLYAYVATKEAASVAPAGKRIAEARQTDEEDGVVEVGGITIVQGEGITGSANATAGGNYGGGGGSGGGYSAGGGANTPTIAECRKINTGVQRGKCCAQITPDGAKPGCCTAPASSYPPGLSGKEEMKKCCVYATKKGSAARIMCCSHLKTGLGNVYYGKCMTEEPPDTQQSQQSQQNAYK